MRRTLLLLSLSALAPLAHAQTEPTPKAQTLPVQFQFTPPGARAVGMGAAFIAIADDATASQSNPAGLVILTRPEISGHLRVSRFDTEYPNPFDESTQTFSKRVTSPSFFSFVYPLKNAAISVYYQQATHFKSEAAFSSTYDLVPGFGVTESLSLNDDLLLDQLGLSVGFKLGPKLSIGGSVRTSRLKLDSHNEYRLDDVAGDHFLFTDETDDSGRKVTFNGGILVNPNGKVSAGAFYNQGGKYDLTRVARGDSSGPILGNDFDSGPDSTTTRFEVPSYGGVGLAFRPTDRWILATDVVFVNYSVLSPSQAELADDEDREAVKDGTQFHFGTEYTFMSGKMPVSVRAGVYNDPDHDGLRGVDSGQIFGTFGAGFVFGGKFQVDFAANISKRVKETLVSAVYRF